APGRDGGQPEHECKEGELESPPRLAFCLSKQQFPHSSLLLIRLRPDCWRNVMAVAGEIQGSESAFVPRRKRLTSAPSASSASRTERVRRLNGSPIVRTPSPKLQVATARAPA